MDPAPPWLGAGQSGFKGARYTAMLEVQRYIAEYHDWFYLITLVWTFFEGESFVILAGAVAAKGMLDPFALFASACIGSWLGDQWWFFVGRYFGHMLVKRFPDWQLGIDRIHRWIERWEVLFILTFRFIYGIRNFSSAALGISSINAYKFMGLNFLSAMLWSACFVGGGYLFGQAIERLLGRWGTSIEVSIFCAVAVVMALAWVISRVLHARATAAKRLAAIETDPLDK